MLSSSSNQYLMPYDNVSPDKINVEHVHSIRTLAQAAVQMNLVYRNNQRNETNSNTLTQSQNRNFATVLVWYEEDGETKLRAFQAYSLGNNKNTGNHAERLAWERAKREMQSSINAGAKIKGIAVMSELSPCAEYEDNCRSYFGVEGGATKGKENSLKFNPERDTVCWVVEGSLNDVLDQVNRANEDRHTPIAKPKKTGVQLEQGKEKERKKQEVNSKQQKDKRKEFQEKRKKEEKKENPYNNRFFELMEEPEVKKQKNSKLEKTLSSDSKKLVVGTNEWVEEKKHGREQEKIRVIQEEKDKKEGWSNVKKKKQTMLPQQKLYNKKYDQSSYELKNQQNKAPRKGPKKKGV